MILKLTQIILALFLDKDKKKMTPVCDSVACLHCILDNKKVSNENVNDIPQRMHVKRDGCRARHTILGNACWHRCTRVLCGRDNNIILLFFIILSSLILSPPQLFISSLPRPGEIL